MAVNETLDQLARELLLLADFALPDRRESQYVSMHDAEYSSALPQTLPTIVVERFLSFW
jgi:hypothetical protein